ncbi:MAG: glycoside hydrolase family 71/99-like protein [Candidatus Latescibacterota bacterium]|nr:glycoside hydrolase family 71/99-like protein [Candidatus Latescibacterota bacterium]
MKINFIILWAFVVSIPLNINGQSAVVNKLPQVVKANPMPIYVHYMPWFDAPESHEKEKWGLHWTMATQNPEIILENGQRQIASYYYPLIGPYDSGDPALIEYHLLLMKYSGIDGILIDWSSSHDILDYQSNRQNAEALIKKIDSVGMRFAIVYEDYTSNEVAIRSDSIRIDDAARADLHYISNNYFSLDSYLYVGGAPLLLVFGPRQIVSDDSWTDLLNICRPVPHFVPLWNRSNGLPSSSFGEFAWVDSDHLNSLFNYYNSTAYKLNWVLGAAYPGFHDFYKEGGWEQQLGWKINHNGSQTFSETLKMAKSANINAVQLVTWNDFGEGTMIEPTKEFGYTLLEELQNFSGVVYNSQVFDLIHSLYTNRKLHADNDYIQAQLDTAFFHFANLNVVKAKTFLKP